MKPWNMMRLLGEEVDNVSTIWNPSDKSADISLSNGNSTATKTSTGTERGVRALGSKSSGKWCLPVLIDRVTENGIDIGLATSSASLSEYQLGFDSYGWGFDSGNGKLYHSRIKVAYSTPYSSGDVIEILFNADSGELRFTKNGSVLASGAAAVTGLTGPLFAAISFKGNGDGATIKGVMSSYAESNGYALWTY